MLLVLNNRAQMFHVMRCLHKNIFVIYKHGVEPILDDFYHPWMWKGGHMISRALDKRKYLMMSRKFFLLILHKKHVVTPSHRACLMRGGFNENIRKIIP